MHPTGLTTRTDSRRTRGERTSSSTTLGGWIQRHGLRHRPWVPYRGEPRGTHRRETPRRITQPRGGTARRGHGPAGQPTVTAVRALRAKSGFVPQGRTLLQACTRHTTPRRPPARIAIPATGHETTARSGITMRDGTPCHRRAMRRTAHPARVPPNQWEQLRLQSRSLLTPAALGDGVRTGIAAGGRAPHTGKPPALPEVRKYAARRGSTSPPRWTAGKEADTEGDLPPDKGDRYVDLDGTSHEPERRANHAELAWARAEVKRLRVQLETLRGRSRARALGARV